MRLDHNIVAVVQFEWLAVTRDDILERRITTLNLLKCVGNSSDKSPAVKLHECSTHVCDHLALTCNAKQRGSSEIEDQVHVFERALERSLISSLITFDFFF